MADKSKKSKNSSVKDAPISSLAETVPQAAADPDANIAAPISGPISGPDAKGNAGAASAAPVDASAAGPVPVDAAETPDAKPDAKPEKPAKANKPEKAPKAEPAPDMKPLGTAKAVETLFRNAYRAELDIIALAATKANIMISLNGFIISALMISGAFIFASSPSFMLPAGMFMVTAAASIVFALLAASPETADLFADIWGWMRDVVRRRASLRDLRTRVIRGRDMTGDETLNILNYEHRVRISREDYWNRMQALLRDRDDVYYKMSDQLYTLGLMANRKFKLLNISYTLFRWGLLASLISFLGLKSFDGIFAGLSDRQTAVQLRNMGIAEFNDIYEPSAVQQLPDGRLLVVEDESTRALSLMSIGPDGTLVEDSVADLKLMRGFGRKLNDLEGLSIDDREFIYATTSHSLNSKGERVADREQMLRFRIKGGAVGDISSFAGLRDAIMADAGLKQAVAEAAGVPADFARLNIEGLSYHRASKTLMLGVREPTVAGQSLILVIRNPDAVFEHGETPHFGAPILLDLQGGGVRALSYDPVLGAFLIVNEIEGHEGNRYSQLWSWSGEPGIPALPVALPDIINLNNVESIDSIMVHGEPRLLIMSDEGNEEKNQPAKYMMLDYGQLRQ